MVAFGCVIVDDVEHYFEPGVVQPRHRGAKDVQRIVLRVTRLRGEERKGVVAPVVR